MHCLLRWHFETKVPFLERGIRPERLNSYPRNIFLIPRRCPCGLCFAQPSSIVYLKISFTINVQPKAEKIIIVYRNFWKTYLRVGFARLTCLRLPLIRCKESAQIDRCIINSFKWPNLFVKSHWILASFFFSMLWTSTSIKSIKTPKKKKFGQYPAILTSRLVKNTYNVPLKSEVFNYLLFCYNPDEHFNSSEREILLCSTKSAFLIVFITLTW